jgi:23S rRNA pseudouridine2605 synthase
MIEKGERLAKVIARAGICSRRKAEELILTGKVSVDGTTILTPAFNVNSHNIVKVEGTTLPQKEQTRLWKYHKPVGLICSHGDPQGRSTVFDEIRQRFPNLPSYVISIGRLDFNSEGLLLLTNDGNLSRYLELPSTGWVRRYRVKVKGHANPDQMHSLKDGITIDEIHYKNVLVTVEKKESNSTLLTVKLSEGKNREIRRIMQHLGYHVISLMRLSYGPFLLGKLGPNELEEVPQKFLREQLGEKFG